MKFPADPGKAKKEQTLPMRPHLIWYIGYLGRVLNPKDKKTAPPIALELNTGYDFADFREILSHISREKGGETGNGL